MQYECSILRITRNTRKSILDREIQAELIKREA
jgi:hypothetical protein